MLRYIHCTKLWHEEPDWLKSDLLIPDCVANFEIYFWPRGGIQEYHCITIILNWIRKNVQRMFDSLMDRDKT